MMGSPAESANSRNLGSRLQAPGAVFIGLLLISTMIFAFPVLTRLGDSCVGACVRDFRLYVWSMAYLDHVVRVGADPFWTELLWAPAGTNLTWVTTLPVPALVMLPITTTAGPIVSANVLLLLAPPLAGWSMYLVCREVTGRPMPSFFGALVFAFSTYVGQLMRAQLNLLLMFWLPLTVYLFLRHLEGKISTRRFVISLTLVIIGQFLTSTEILAMTAFCGGIAWVTFFIGGSQEMRRLLREKLPATALSYLLASLALLPVLIRTLASTPSVVLRPTEQNSADLLSPLIPGVSTWIGGNLMSSVSGRFLDADNFGYFGVVFLGIVVAFASKAKARAGTKALTILFATFVVLAMGPRLHILSERGFWLPGYALNYAPLLQHAVPVRFVLFAWFMLALIVALWLADTGPRTIPKYVLVALGIFLVLPSQRSVRDTSPVYHQEVTVPAFFNHGNYKDFIGPGDIVLAVPSDVGEELLWQIEGSMDFRLASAYIGPTKPKNGLGNLSQRDAPPDAEAFARQIDAADVDVVIAAYPLTKEWYTFLAAVTDTEPLIVDDVAIFSTQQEP